MCNLGVFLLLLQFMNSDRDAENGKYSNCMVHSIEQAEEDGNYQDEKVQIIVTNRELEETVKKLNKRYTIKYRLPMIDSFVIEAEDYYRKGRIIGGVLWLRWTPSLQHR